MNWAYLLRCRDGSLYAGWTNDLPKRLKAHNSGAGGKYTRSRRPVQLAWAESYETRTEAMRQEVALKRMTKAQKEELVTGFQPENGWEPGFLQGEEKSL